MHRYSACGWRSESDWLPTSNTPHCSRGLPGWVQGDPGVIFAVGVGICTRHSIGMTLLNACLAWTQMSESPLLASMNSAMHPCIQVTDVHTLVHWLALGASNEGRQQCQWFVDPKIDEQHDTEDQSETSNEAVKIGS
jgi:hypothetical protein